jgi:hypothetical protein
MMRVPQILDEQEVIINWAISMKTKHFDISSIISLLLSPKPSKYHKDNEDYLKAREVYERYNNGYKSSVLEAIMMDCYALENDFKEGDIVTNGIVVGFATGIDLNRREFRLFSDMSFPESTLGRFKMIDFSRVGKRKS